MGKRSSILVSVLVVACLTCANLVGAQEMKYAPVDQPSIDGFSAVALLTTDEDWQEKWASPATPAFGTSATLQLGQQATLLVLFSNAQEREGKVSVLCDIEIFEDGKSLAVAKKHECWPGDTSDPPELLRMTSMSAVVLVTPKDLGQLVTIHVGVTDGHRGLRIPLWVSVNMGKKVTE